jgi:hypothetical protein
MGADQRAAVSELLTLVTSATGKSPFVDEKDAKIVIAGRSLTMECDEDGPGNLFGCRRFR